jgi:hypothetical protein
LPLYPTSTNNRNELTVHCDDCEFKAASTFSRELRLGGIELSKITGKYTTTSTTYPFVQNSSDHSNTNRVIFNGEFTGIDTSLFVLANPMNWQFEGTYINKESDDVVISTSVGNGSTKPILKNFYVVSPATTPITSSAATTWNVTGAHENNLFRGKRICCNQTGHHNFRNRRHRLRFQCSRYNRANCLTLQPHNHPHDPNQRSWHRQNNDLAHPRRKPDAVRNID